MASPSNSLFSTYSQDSSISSRGSSCAYPSWPSGHSLGYGNSSPSSFISDEDLFPEELDDLHCGPLLQEPPAPPRQPPMAQAFPVLPPLYALEKPKKSSSGSRRRSSGRKPQRTSKPMAPIAESPEAVE
ncbi:hypothetical protein GQ43DRAFT_471153 [Delitschia confertaspora ATCC 74209]|uniref:Uncharacterized protein n=1 Tax=Delitschia confertaspora ATCC 74209 TaxID=1513339 RepID=A0A9P4JN71_9PLEO|nr:hypothetical protein GQ43DRAFT_471153 [Delitschia confertaspora ATCC 74209]